MIVIKQKVHFHREAKGRRRVSAKSPSPSTETPGRVPRIARLMALAIRLDGLMRSGEIASIMELARLGHITQPRASQILNLNHLAPDIQKELLLLPPAASGRPPIHEKVLRPIAAQIDCAKQRRMWRNLRQQAKQTGSPGPPE